MLKERTRRVENSYRGPERGSNKKGSNSRDSRIREPKEGPAHYKVPSKAERHTRALEVMQRVGTLLNVIIKVIRDLVDDIIHKKALLNFCYLIKSCLLFLSNETFIVIKFVKKKFLLMKRNFI